MHVAHIAMPCRTKGLALHSMINCVIDKSDLRKFIIIFSCSECQCVCIRIREMHYMTGSLVESAILNTI